jgi:hypothetical protein
VLGRVLRAWVTSRVVVTVAVSVGADYAFNSAGVKATVDELRGGLSHDL